MRVRKEQKDFIVAEIEEQIARQLDTFRPHGWRKAVFFIRELGPIVGFIGVVVALVALVAAGWFQAFARLEKETEFRTRTNEKLGVIDGKLSDIQATLLNLRAADSPKDVLDEMAKVEFVTFAKALPALSKVIARRPSEVNATAATLKEVAAKLQTTNQNTLNYWPTVLRFIQFASSGISPNVPPPGSPPKFIVSQVSAPPGTAKMAAVIPHSCPSRRRLNFRYASRSLSNNLYRKSSKVNKCGLYGLRI